MRRQKYGHCQYIDKLFSTKRSKIGSRLAKMVKACVKKAKKIFGFKYKPPIKRGAEARVKNCPKIQEA